ncbi:acyltransferase domain-containing protein [Amycolatopsis sp. NPDC058278]|uniref:acyltransferase domain-containing protein n=1 Tax=Amycolatopsis sp. NPDC058278 TaxID=3346417 RepID=UPI0036D8A692
MTEQTVWPEADRPRRAGVSSFGISGTNAHVVLEAPPAPAAVESEVDSLLAGPLPWVLSAKSPAALRAQAAQLHALVLGRPGISLDEVGFSLASRSVFEHRAVVLGDDREALLEGLVAVASGQDSVGVVSGKVAADQDVVLVFPGQGSQWVGMAAGLLGCSGVFAAELAACDEVFGRFVGWSVVDVVRGVSGVPGLDRIDVLQPVLFSVMVSLAAVWRAAGVRVAGVVGSSQGEVAAAYVAGALSLEDAVRIVAVRSRLFFEELVGGGAIASVGAGVGWVSDRLVGEFGGLVVAGVNGPGSCTVAGEVPVLERFVELCVGGGVRARVVPVSVASHCGQVDRLRGRLVELLGEVVPYGGGEVRFYSTVTGGLVDGGVLGAEYWFENARRPVEFERVTRALLGDGFGLFVEVSPHPVLTVSVMDTVAAVGGGAVVVGTLRRGEEERGRFLRSLSEVFTAGATVDWKRVFGNRNRLVELPTYAFQHERYWLDAVVSTDDVLAAGEATRLPTVDGWLFTGKLSLDLQPWLAEHSFRGTVVVPASLLTDLALRAGARSGCPRVAELTMNAPVVLQPGEVLDVQVMVEEPGEAGVRAVTVYFGRGPDDWTLHASGSLAPATVAGAGDRAGAWPPEGVQAIATDDVYARFAETGYEYGPAFRGVRALWSRGDEVFAEVALPESLDPAGRFLVHPALLDAALQPVGAVALADAGEPTPQMPFAWNDVSVHAVGATAVRVRMVRNGDKISVRATDPAGLPVFSVDSLTLRPFDPDLLAAAVPARAKAPIVELPTAGGAEAAGFGRRLAALPAEDRRTEMLALVRTQIAAVLGYRSAGLVETDRAFKELGFESVTAVELRNRLATATELTLPATLAFDHPTAEALAEHLLRLMDDGGSESADAWLSAVDDLEELVAERTPEGTEREKLARRLQNLVWKLEDRSAGTEPADRNGLEDVSDDEMFTMLGEEFGIS